VVVSEPRWVFKLVNCLTRARGNRVKDGALFHELRYKQMQRDAVEEIAEKLKSKGYRDE